MRRGPRGATATALVGAILLSLALINLKVPFSSAVAEASIDIFTQQTPYSGKGSNVPSDAFGPGDVVVLNALTTLNGTPVQNLLVVFTVTPPTNASFSLTAATNSTGIASVSFTLPTPGAGLDETQVFGMWLASASAIVRGVTVEDTLSFKVNWIVQIVSVRTIDGSLSNRTVFGLGGDVGFEIALRSVAYSFKNITLAITVMDELNVPIDSSQIDGFVVQPNQTLMFMYAKANIPKEGVFIGNATAFFSVLTAPASQGGVPYSPPVSVVFDVVPNGNVTIALRDVAAINVIALATSIQIGELLSVNVLVQNEGTETEVFNVNAFLGNMLTESLNESALSPYAQANLQFILNTSALSPGNYTVRAEIPHLPNEADVTDNVFVDGTVEVKPIPPVFIHNVAVTDITTSKGDLHVGDLLQINVTVLNKGNATEAFQVTAFFNSSAIQSVQVDDLAPSTRTTLVFTWNTSSVAEGTYLIKAFASLPVDIDMSDNTCVDGFVTVTKVSPGPGFSVRDLFLWLLLLLLLLIILTAALFFVSGRRKRKKEDTSVARVLPPCFGDIL